MIVSYKDIHRNDPNIHVSEESVNNIDYEIWIRFLARSNVTLVMSMSRCVWPIVRVLLHRAERDTWPD